MSPLFI